jgi:hypothetical protein
MMRGKPLPIRLMTGVINTCKRLRDSAFDEGNLAVVFFARDAGARDERSGSRETH